MKQVFLALVVSSFTLMGCDKPDAIPGPPPTGGGVEEQPKTDKPEEQPKTGESEPTDEPADDTTTDEPADDTTEGEPGASPGDTEPSAEGDGCPPAREPEGMCAQVMTWAKHPDSGKCCLYSTPCEAPKGWKTFGNEKECTGGN